MALAFPPKKQIRAKPNGLELSCPAARATAHPFSLILAGKPPPNFPHASRVSCSEVFGGPQLLGATMWLDWPHHHQLVTSGLLCDVTFRTVATTKRTP
jgi:hypothetical protein